MRFSLLPMMFLVSGFPKVRNEKPETRKGSAFLIFFSGFWFLVSSLN
jgi:hypothetical protein